MCASYKDVTFDFLLPFLSIFSRRAAIATNILDRHAYFTYKRAVHEFDRMRKLFLVEAFHAVYLLFFVVSSCIARNLSRNVANWKRWAQMSSWRRKFLCDIHYCCLHKFYWVLRRKWVLCGGNCIPDISFCTFDMLHFPWSQIQLIFKHKLTVSRVIWGKLPTSRLI